MEKKKVIKKTNVNEKKKVVKKKNKKKKKPKKGFTLIELLAVIVILGLLMVIAIPSVTKYITQSRKKTVSTTIGNYVGALTNQVNDMEYIFTGANTIYAVPIECISLERGGTNPFGKWHQANDNYWAYVLIQYNDETSSYTYGFTFKDSAGYGLYPTTIEKLNENGSQINTNLTLTRPTSGTITNIATKNNWIGFNLTDDTNLIVLEAESEGTLGDGVTTCTLCQKGDNYSDVEKEKLNRPQAINKLIRIHNELITDKPSLASSAFESGDKYGLYSSTATNSGQPTYYFRGDVKNNNVKFAGLDWKIIRINEDGSVRLIFGGKLSTSNFNSSGSSYINMYYSESNVAKPTVDAWYQTNIVDKGFSSYVVKGKFCEQAKVRYSSEYVAGGATTAVYNEYVPDFKCSVDGNGKGPLELDVGLVTYDEATHAGSYYDLASFNYYMITETWTMSPSGYPYYPFAGVWATTYPLCGLGSGYVTNRSSYLRPVININGNLIATGTGTSKDPYVIQTN